VTIVIDVANVMGSRPDGWWRDRAGAAVRLHDEVVQLSASGHVTLPAAGDKPGPEEPATGQSAAGDEPALGKHADEPGNDGVPGFVMVLEGAARAAARRISPPPREDADVTGGVAPGEVLVVLARGSGDDTIVAVARDVPGPRYVVTADRELRRRCAAAGAEILGPGWLLSQLRPAAP
jgi:8-oxo-dGTP diphosphatase